MTVTAAAWTDADLIALDLEGSGPQDPDGEAILEIALVPIRQGRPDVDAAFSTLINPGRRIRRGPWISPGITNNVLSAAPPAAAVGADILSRVEGKILVGHNVRVDWRLLHKRFPDAAPAGLLDTMRLARSLHPDQKRGHGLGPWIDRLGLAHTVDAAAPGSQPHRALWDTVAAALLLGALMDKTSDPTAANLRTLAGVPLTDERATPPPATQQQGLWDLS
jgi:DNA polymerase-3 subunit epsilon